MSLLYESTRVLLRFSLNLVVRVLAVTGAWLFACGIAVAGHHAFGLIAWNAYESTATLVRGLLTVYLLAAATLNTVINVIDLYDLVRVYLKARAEGLPEEEGR